MSERPLALDLCCGTKSATRPFVDAGWDVITVDVDERFTPDVLVDVRKYVYRDQRRIDFVWASPPCTEFALEFMPWSRTGRAPDLSIWRACQRIISEVKPRYWIIENVRGAVRYMGSPRKTVGPFFFWGHFPDFSYTGQLPRKEHMSSSADVQRGMIPYGIGAALCRSVSSQLPMEFRYE